MSPRTAYATLLNLSKTAWMDYIRPLEQQIIHTYSLRLLAAVPYKAYLCCPGVGVWCYQVAHIQH